jgi:hypothetical protein
MLTAGDIQFEPQQSKIAELTNSLAVMIAGDSAMQAEILQDVRTDVTALISRAPTVWVSVRDVADSYDRRYHEARSRRADAYILSPLGLGNGEFLRRQAELEPQLIRQLASEIINFAPPPLAAIICGVDDHGPHIYIATNTGNSSRALEVTCQDSVGFAAIGAGSWHADSQFMFAGHTKARPLPATLLLTYSAKKRAESAPGVGTGTDMFIIGPGPGTYSTVVDSVVLNLENIYQDGRKRIEEVALILQKNVETYVDDIAKAAATAAATADATEQQTDIAPESGDSSVNKANTRTDPSEAN